jgi:hypothetical protein
MTSGSKLYQREAKKPAAPSSVSKAKTPVENVSLKSSSPSKVAHTAPTQTSNNGLYDPKYEVMPDKVNLDDLEVFSDYSYDETTDIDKPDSTKMVTCKTQIVNGDDNRKLVIRKVYYLNDGTELRVKNIRLIKSKSKANPGDEL